MQVSQPNDVKIYNLSAGKSLPEWLTERRRRLLQKEDVDIRRRIELIQDFEMPTASTHIEISEDGSYVLASGCYKPRVRCYDLSQMSMKFERCLDSDIVKFKVLSDDYSKLVFLNCDRYVEFHAQYGRYYKTRIPKFGRDLVYHYPSCDLYLVGESPEVYRLNLEQGRFLNPLQTDSDSINCCDINFDHQLLAVGTSQGHVQCWDPRSRSRVGQVDVATNELGIESNFPEVTAIKYCNGLTLGVGTSTGHVLLYDIRSDKPFLIKDHQYGLPVNSLAFQNDSNLVMSADSKIVKIWHRDSGKPFTAVEPGTNINNLCAYPNSGLLFMATEAQKMLIYYIPSLGPAPRWCSFLDSLTEELEEDAQPVVYDDYKFVTKQDLTNIGLSHLIGTNLLRAYMHGFFIDIQLYHKAKSISEPFAYEEYRKNLIKKKIEEERGNRVMAKKLPKVNRQLAEKLLDDANDGKNIGKVDVSNPLGDDRFAAIFTNPDFEVDESSEQYQLLHPITSKKEKERKQRQEEMKQKLENFNEISDGEVEGVASDDNESSSDDDDYIWRQEYKKRQRETKVSRQQPKFYELKNGEEFSASNMKENMQEKRKKTVALGERLDEGLDTSIIRSGGSKLGSKEIVFKVNKSQREIAQDDAAKAHRKERQKVRRSAKSIMPKEKRAVYWRGRRLIKKCNLLERGGFE
ncbi:nucleolar protein 10-like isoform X2 [Xenia sp. Carnegie-2017]|uniref:nucleolar protein 10-like isoform X2 n=1 Tax=Xenia sp. Carnegie-2017 TaxID=2897299 RepID=UPI001F039352|nr:nucleolar protein 10-like isoform X2 [Xenia sp. Carnegie-2017]